MVGKLRPRRRARTQRQPEPAPNLRSQHEYANALRHELGLAVLDVNAHSALLHGDEPDAKTLARLWDKLMTRLPTLPREVSPQVLADFFGSLAAWQRAMVILCNEFADAVRRESLDEARSHPVTGVLRTIESSFEFALQRAFPWPRHEVIPGNHDRVPLAYEDSWPNDASDRIARRPAGHDLDVAMWVKLLASGEPTRGALRDVASGWSEAATAAMDKTLGSLASACRGPLSLAIRQTLKTLPGRPGSREPGAPSAEFEDSVIQAAHEAGDWINAPELLDRAGFSVRSNSHREKLAWLARQNPPKLISNQRHGYLHPEFLKRDPSSD